MARRETDEQDQRFPDWWRRKQLRGLIFERTWRGKKVIHTWPKPKGPARTPGEAEAENLFKKLAHAQMNAWEVDRRAAEAIAVGSQYTWRDVLGRAMVGRLITYELENPGVLDDVSIQTQLDSISNIPGTMLMRTPEQWVALVNVDEKAVLGWDIVTHMPVWIDQPASGITELTGPVTAGPGTGVQATTIEPTGVTPGSYTGANITVDLDGRISEAANGTATAGITQLTGPVTAGPGSGIQGSIITPTGVAAGTYNYATVQVGADGRVITASTGTIPTPPAATELVPGWITNRYYTPGSVSAGVSWLANTLYATLFRVPLVFEADECVITVATAAALSEVTVGLYENNGGVPGALLRTLGTAVTTTTGGKTISFSHVTEDGPWIFFAVAIGVRITTTQNIAETLLTGELLGNSAAGSTTSPLTGWRASYTYSSGVLPNPFPASPTQNQSAPALWFRKI